MAGIVVTKDNINSTAGGICRDLRLVFERIETMRAYLLITSDQAMLDMGFTQIEVNDIKAAFTRLDILRGVYEGGAPVAQEDFREFPKRLWGTGL